jgi:hypothetical protein
MYARTNLRDAIKSIIWAWNMLAEPPKSMGSLLYEFFPQGKMIVHILDAAGSNLMV